MVCFLERESEISDGVAACKKLLISLVLLFQLLGSMFELCSCLRCILVRKGRIVCFIAPVINGLGSISSAGNRETRSRNSITRDELA